MSSQPRCSLLVVAGLVGLGLLLFAAPAAARLPDTAPSLSLRMRRATTSVGAAAAPAAPPRRWAFAASGAPALTDPSATGATSRGEARGPADEPPGERPKFYQRGWFWPVLAGVVATVIITIVVAESIGGSDRLPTGSLGTVQVKL